MAGPHPAYAARTLAAPGGEGTGPTWWATLPAGQPAHGRHTAHGPALPARH